ncbi:hypothetical protein EMPG_14370, partial [Blastomyces silverae]
SQSNGISLVWPCAEEIGRKFSLDGQSITLQLGKTEFVHAETFNLVACGCGGEIVIFLVVVIRLESKVNE